jgi:hypothetical protein
MRYSKAHNQGPKILDPASSWGLFTCYVELGDDLYALRHVEVFENGNYLRYDRRHWDDDFGMLADARASKKLDEHWGAVAISKSEFERVWQESEKSPIWQLQQASEHMSRYGAVPPWILIDQERRRRSK